MAISSRISTIDRVEGAIHIGSDRLFIRDINLDEGQVFRKIGFAVYSEGSDDAAVTEASAARSPSPIPVPPPHMTAIGAPLL